jgi:hypothetical protein
MKQLILSFTILFCLTLNAQKEKLTQSSWNEKGQEEVTASSGQYTFSEKGKLSYFLSNNNESIFIDIKIEDAGVQNRILKEGLTIWVNMDGKSAKKMGIRYPIGSEYSGNHNKQGMPETRLNADGSLVTPLSMANTIELTGFTNEESRRFPSSNPDNFRGSVKYDKDGNLLYKMVMPVEKLPVRNSKDGVGAMPFTLGIEYGAPPSQSNSKGNTPPPQYSGSSSGAGSRGGSGGGSRPGTAPKSGRPPVPSSGEKMITPVSFWIKEIKLATDK